MFAGTSVTFAQEANVAHHARRALDGVTYRYYMEPSRYQTKLCVGDPVKYDMHVYRQAMGTDTSRTDVFSTKVEAYPNDKSIGSFAQANVVVSIGSDGYPGIAGFTFTGKKVGKTTLVFQGKVAGVEIQRGYVSFNIDIQVIQCKFKISGTTRFPIRRTPRFLRRRWSPASNLCNW